MSFGRTKGVLGGGGIALALRGGGAKGGICPLPW